MMKSPVPQHTAERLTQPFAYHGEAPFWDALGNRLLCVDVFAGTVVAIDSDGGLSFHPVPGQVTTVIRPRRSGGFIVANGHGFVLADQSLQKFSKNYPIADIAGDPAIRTNDGGCDPLGGFVIGTMEHKEAPGRGAVYRVAPDLSVTRILPRVSISNGVQWSADGSTVFYVDTPTRSVAAFDVDPSSGVWTNRRVHILIDEKAGYPDGIAIDEEDGLWIALWGGGMVIHYDIHGRYVESVSVPGVSQVSACTFGGADRRRLFITTSRKDLPVDREPDAGAVFSVQTNTRGAIPAEFAG